MKTVLAVAALVASTSAQADSITLGYFYDDQRDSDITNETVSVSYKKNLHKNLDFDLGFTDAERSDGRELNRYTVGITPKYKNLSLALRVGKKHIPNQETVNFYMIEPAYRFKITNKLDLSLAYNYREAFGDADDLRHGPKLSVGYKLDETWKASLGYFMYTNSRDQDTDRFIISITKSF